MHGADSMKYIFCCTCIDFYHIGENTHTHRKNLGAVPVCTGFVKMRSRKYMIVVSHEMMRWKIKVHIRNYGKKKATFFSLFPTEQNLNSKV